MSIPFALYLPEFIALFITNGINLISPGAGFVITSRNSVFFSRGAGVITGLGIVTSSLIHKNIAILGYGLIIQKSPQLGLVIQGLGCAYLAYLSYGCFKNAYVGGGDNVDLRTGQSARNYPQAFRMGFFTDLFNPQASICFMCIVAATISPETPLGIQGIYVAILLCCSIAWYSLVAFSFSMDLVRAWYLRGQRWFELIFGSVMLYLSAKLFLALKLI